MCLFLTAHLPAQAPSSAALPASPSPIEASVSVDANTGGGGTWLQLTPGVGYTFSPRWSAEVGVPVYYVSVEATSRGTSSVGGVGDVYGSLSLDMSTKNATLYTTATVSAPTGSLDKGLGAGQASWDWTTHLAGSLGRFGPYVNGGFANNEKTANESVGQGAGTSRPASGISVGTMGHAEAGLEVGLPKSISMTASWYAVVGLRNQTVVPPVWAPQPVRPGAGALPQRQGARLGTGAGAGRPLVVQGAEVSDHGVGMVLWAQLTPRVDLSLWVSHSLAYADYTTVSVSTTIGLTPGRRERRAK